MRQILHIYVCAVLLFLPGGFFVSARSDTLEVRETKFMHSAGLNLRPAYVVPSHGFYRGWNDLNKPISVAGTLDIQYSLIKDKQHVYQGIGLAVHTFFAHDILGTPATIYAFQGAPIALLAKNLAIGYEWNLGLSAGWKDNGQVTVSPLNVYINVALLFTWRLNQYWDIKFGPEFTHFSNGDTAFPNGGANTINFRIGCSRHFQPMGSLGREKIFMPDDERQGFGKKMSYDLALLGGWRADRYISDDRLQIINKAFPIAGLHFTPLYHFNKYLGLGPSIEFQYDSSANRDCINGLMQSALGLSGRFEVKMPVFALNVGLGYGFQLGHHDICTNNELEGLYGVFGLKAFLTKRLFLNINYRLGTVPYAHNLMYGLGWRFGYIKE